MNFLKKGWLKAGVFIAGLLAAGASQAAITIDVSEIVTMLTGTGVDAVKDIGTGILAICGVVLLFRLVRRAM